ncbi:hypothetical protein Tco_1078655 [Tanacetum coccineum]|uniref:Uncharacterized protein n=1 Tax=Tanacetum coccineum TaxID=301880 RepID=A0ABQ5HQ67_9ASTR
MENTLALNHKLDGLIESLKSLPKKTNAEDLAKHEYPFRKLLEEIHVTWAHLEKKWTILQLYTKVAKEKSSQWLDTALDTGDAIRIAK